eukprot:TRINITY_DN14262_c0_g6_i1.p1 TRINITY_DN14262_c0_g6~~TRINITY_DN14262_c0_g6_i1.p1  ORF type:complete len:380 (-),score=26.21 TRINITY_DN14262_c0_g6_i1:41-1180(-)
MMLQSLLACLVLHRISELSAAVSAPAFEHRKQSTGSGPVGKTTSVKNIMLIQLSSSFVMTDSDAHAEHAHTRTRPGGDMSMQEAELASTERGSQMSRGVQRAASWAHCHAWAKSIKHSVQVVVSSDHNFVYVDNVKAASTSIRTKLSKVLKATWGIDGVRGRKAKDRITTFMLDDEREQSRFHFSFVRDPLEKFESGVRQAWKQNESLSQFSADELLDMQLQRFEEVKNGNISALWLNEHLQPSSWRMSGYVGQEPVRLDFIGSVETFSEDWPAATSSFANISLREKEKLHVLGHDNPREATEQSMLSQDAIKRMCKSGLYEHEWECFGYERPDMQMSRLTISMLCLILYHTEKRELAYSRSEERRVGKECRSRWSPYH